MERLKAIIDSAKRYARHPYLPESRGSWIALAVAIPLVSTAGLVISGLFSEAFRTWLMGMESGGAAIRNAGLIIAALTALPVAIWRGIVADKQADAAQQSLRNERYQKGAEMLGDENLSVRLVGIYTLQRLAEEHPREFHVQIMRLFCAFVRNPTADEKYELELEKLARESGDSWIRDDVQLAMTSIGRRDSLRISLEAEAGYRLELSGIRLRHLTLMQGNLTDAALQNTDLSNAYLVNTNLSECMLQEANLSGAKLVGAIVSGTSLGRAVLKAGGDARITIYSFGPVTGLTQSQVDQSRADPNNRPKLEGAIDAETGKQLVWRGAPLKD